MGARRTYLPPEQATVVATDYDLAWVAGFMEGEASFTVRSGSDLRPRVSVPQKDREPLEFLLRWFGGRIYYDRTRDYYIWVVRSDLARRVMEQVRPWIRSRRRLDQLDLALTVSRASVVKGSPEYLEQRRQARRGKTNSPEHRAKISVAITKHWKTRKKEEH